MFRFFRLIGWFEGSSFLILFLIAMPMKYIAHNPTPVRIFGSLHGGLFLLFIGLAFILFDKSVLNRKQLLQAMVASVLPFGTFVYEKRVLDLIDNKN